MSTRMHPLAVSLMCHLLLAASASAAAPTTITHHGRILQGGTPVDGSLAVRFALYDAPEGGVLFWEEQLSLQVSNGYYSAVFGLIQPFDAELLGVAGELWLSLSIGGGAELTPRLPVTSVPYALAAERAAQADDVSCSACISATEVAFAYARADAAAGAALDLACSDCITSTEIENAAIVTAKLADGAVATTKLADAAVTTDKLANAAVTRAKLQPCALDQVLEYNGSAWACSDKLAAFGPYGTIRCREEYDLLELTASAATYLPSQAKRAELFQYGWICWNRSGDGAKINPLTDTVLLNPDYANWTASNQRVCGRITWISAPDQADFRLRVLMLDSAKFSGRLGT